jgi:Zn-dependent alcohol dehydrogenase
MTRTTALIAPSLDGSFELKEVCLDSLQPDEALVEIHASGVCHTDLACASGKLPCAPNAVLGHEGKPRIAASQIRMLTIMTIFRWRRSS